MRISKNVIIFCNYMFCEVYKSHPWRHGYPADDRRISAIRTAGSGGWVSNKKKTARLIIQSRYLLLFYIPFHLWIEQEFYLFFLRTGVFFLKPCIFIHQHAAVLMDFTRITICFARQISKLLSLRGVFGSISSLWPSRPSVGMLVGHNMTSSNTSMLLWALV